MIDKSNKTIYVYDAFSEAEPVLIGQLYVQLIRGNESYSFEFDRDWIKNLLSSELDPELQPFLGRQFPSGNVIYGVFADASPDRWGRALINKKEPFYEMALSAC